MKIPLLVLLFPLPAFADVYTWKENGATRISTHPPAWYRAESLVKGPRVIVTNDRRVTDDTALSMVERWRLRPQEHPPIPAGRRPR